MDGTYTATGDSQHTVDATHLTSPVDRATGHLAARVCLHRVCASKGCPDTMVEGARVGCFKVTLAGILFVDLSSLVLIKSGRRYVPYRPFYPSDTTREA